MTVVWIRVFSPAFPLLLVKAFARIPVERGNSSTAAALLLSPDCLLILEKARTVIRLFFFHSYSIPHDTLVYKTSAKRASRFAITVGIKRTGGEKTRDVREKWANPLGLSWFAG